MTEARIYVDGALKGTHSDARLFVNQFRTKRRRGELPHLINIAFHETANEVNINTDSGRARRPLIIVEGGAPLITEDYTDQLKRGELSFDDLIDNGLIEYIDAEEEENIYVAVNPEDLTAEHTHLEIDPSLILGIATGLVPYLSLIHISEPTRLLSI